MGLFKKLSIILEILVNGTFILFYSWMKADRFFFDVSLWNSVIEVSPLVVPLVILVVLISNFLSQDSVENFIRNHVFSIIIFIPMMISFGDLELAYWLSTVHLFSTITSVIGRWRLATPLKKEKAKKDLRFLFSYKISAAQIVLITWSGLILAGTFLLMLPVSSPQDKDLTLVDALFVATSAVSTTGLNTISTADDLSIFGKVVLLILFQIGGVGFMTLSSSLVYFMGKSISLKERVVMQDILDASSQNELLQMITDIVKYTMVIEFIGAILLIIGFYMEGFELGEAIWYGIFHSISAFCTAGFALFNNGLEDFATNHLISLTITFEAMLGGLGFIVMKELLLSYRNLKSLRMLSMHSKVILTTMISMVFIGTGTIFVGEYLTNLDQFSLFDKFQVSLFQFVAAQSTSGFNTLNFANLQPYTLFLITLIMFIGGSPGSTAGGIKITTLAILIQSVKTTLYGKEEVELFERSVQTSIVVKAIAITMISLLIVCFFVFLMLVLEPNQLFLPLSFEVLSAFGTVGLSMGITGSLSLAGKIAITVVMFIGRIGPLTLVLAVGERGTKAGLVRYPKSKIMIG